MIQQSIKDQLEQLAASKIVAEKRRRSGRPATINPALTKVNVTAFPAGMDPVNLKPLKLPKGAPVNVVFMLDACYDEVVDGLQSLLFPYPKYKLADYSLATADGALIVEGIPFAEFPFNLGRGKRTLWLVRHEREDDARTDFTIHDGCDQTSSPGPQISEGHSITELLAANFQTPTSELWHSSRRESSPTAFGDMTNIKFEELYHLAKADIAASQQSIAILRRFDPASNDGRSPF